MEERYECVDEEGECKCKEEEACDVCSRYLNVRGMFLRPFRPFKCKKRGYGAFEILTNLR